MLRIKNTLSEDAKKDLEDDTFIFGRGLRYEGRRLNTNCIVEEIQRIGKLQRNIVLIAVPDEENLSAGMRSAVRLLSELQDKYI